MPGLLWILFWRLLLGLIPAMIARRKGRSFLLWWIYGTILFIIAFIHSLLIKRGPSYLTQKLKQIYQRHPRAKILVKGSIIFFIVYLLWFIIMGCGVPRYRSYQIHQAVPSYKSNNLIILERKEKCIDNIWAFFERLGGSIITFSEDFTFYKVIPETGEYVLFQKLAHNKPYFYFFSGFYGWASSVPFREFKPYKVRFMSSTPDDNVLCWWIYPTSLKEINRRNWFWSGRVNSDLSDFYNSEILFISPKGIEVILQLNYYDYFTMLRWSGDGKTFYCKVERKRRGDDNKLHSKGTEYLIVNLDGSYRQINTNKEKIDKIEVTPDGRYYFFFIKDKIIRGDRETKSETTFQYPNDIDDLIISPNGKFISYTRYLGKERYREIKEAFVYSIDDKREFSMGEIVKEATWSFQGIYFTAYQKDGKIKIFNGNKNKIIEVLPPSGEVFSGGFWSLDDSSVAFTSVLKNAYNFNLVTSKKISTGISGKRRTLIREHDYYNPKSNLLIQQVKGRAFLRVAYLEEDMDNRYYGVFEDISEKYYEEYFINIKPADFILTISPDGRFIYFTCKSSVSRDVDKLVIIDTDKNETLLVNLERPTGINWNSFSYY